MCAFQGFEAANVTGPGGVPVRGIRNWRPPRRRSNRGPFSGPEQVGELFHTWLCFCLFVFSHPSTVPPNHLPINYSLFYFQQPSTGDQVVEKDGNETRAMTEPRFPRRRGYRFPFRQNRQTRNGTIVEGAEKTEVCSKHLDFCTNFDM